jgi:hypothetical protein
MIQRTGLLVASFAAASTFALALALAGLFPAAAPVDGSQATARPPTVTTEPAVQVHTVYLAAPVEPQTVVVQQAAPGGEDESDEHESDGGDD